MSEAWVEDLYNYQERLLVLFTDRFPDFLCFESLRVLKIQEKEFVFSRGEKQTSVRLGPRSKAGQARQAACKSIEDLPSNNDMDRYKDSHDTQHDQSLLLKGFSKAGCLFHRIVRRSASYESCYRKLIADRSDRRQLRRSIRAL